MSTFNILVAENPVDNVDQAVVYHMDARGGKILIHQFRIRLACNFPD